MVGEFIFIIFLILLAFLGFKLLRGVLKLAMFGLIILAVLLMIGTLAIVIDTRNLQKNLPEGDLLFLLEQDGRIEAGFASKGISGQNVSFLNSSVMEPIVNAYARGDLASATDGYYRVFILQPKVFEPVSDLLQSQNKAYTKQFLLDVLQADDPLGVYVQEQFGDKSAEFQAQAKQALGDHALLKSQLFALLFQKLYDEKGLLYIFVQFKQGNVAVEPESAMFKVIKKLPTSYAKGKVEAILLAAKSKIAEG